MEIDKSKMSRKNVVLTTLGEYRRDSQGWLEWLEESLSKAFVSLSQGATESVPFSEICIVWSFMQLITLLYDKQLNFPLHGNENSIVYSALMVIKISGIPGEFEGGTVFLTLGYFCFLIPLFGLLLFVMVVKNSPIKSAKTSNLVIITNILLQIIYWLMFIPLMDFGMTLQNCSYLEVKTGLHCSGVKIIFHQVAFILLFLVVILLSLAHALFGFNTNPYISDPLSRYQWSFEIFYLCFRFVLVFFIDILPESNYHWIIYIFVLLGSGMMIWYFVMYIPYFNSITCKVFGNCVVSFMWITFCLFFCLGLEYLEIEYFGQSIVVALGIIFICFFMPNFVSNLEERLILDEKNIEIVEECQFCKQMDYIIRLMAFYNIKLSESSYHFHLISGYLMIHRNECQDPSCPLFSDYEKTMPIFGELPANNFKSFKDPVGLRLLINQLYFSNLSVVGLISNHEHSRKADSISRSNIIRGSSTCLSYMFFLINLMKNFYKAAVQISIAEELENGIISRHIIRRAKYYLEEEAGKKSKFNLADRAQEDLSCKNMRIQCRLFVESQIDPRLVIIYEEQFSYFQTLLLDTSKHHLEFWRELSKEKPNLQILHDSGVIILRSTAEINNIWKSLSSISDYFAKANIVYGRYLRNLLGNVEESEYYLRKVIPDTELDNIVQLHKLSINRLLFTQNSGVVTISAMPGSLGKIIKSSENIKNLFGFNSGELLNQHMAILIPDFLDDYHQRFLETYLKSGKRRTIEKLHKVFGAHKSGFLVPFNLLVKHYYDIHFESVLSAFFTLSDVENEFIITNEFGQLVGLTEGAGNTFGGVSPFLLAENEVFIYYFLPDIINNADSELETFSKLEGNFRYKCMIPKSTSVLMTLLRGGREEREAAKIKNDETALQKLLKINKKMIKQCSVKCLQQKKYFAVYKECDSSIIDFDIKNINFPEMNVSFKIFKYNKAKTGKRKVSCNIDNLIHTPESALLLINERKCSSVESPTGSGKRNKVSHSESTFAKLASARLDEEKVNNNRTQLKDQSSVQNFEDKEKETTHQEMLVCKRSQMVSSRDDDRLIAAVKELRESTLKKFDHQLIFILRWKMRVLLLLSCTLASVGFYLQETVDSDCSNLISSIAKNRVTATCKICESSRIIIMTTSYTKYGAPLITPTERSNLYNYSSFDGSPTDYLDFRKKQMKENTDLLLKYEYNGLWVPLLIEDAETRNEIISSEESTTYEAMANQNETEIGRLFTNLNMLIDRAYVIYNTNLASLYPEKYSFYYVLENGFYNINFNEISITIRKGMENEYAKNKIFSISILICSCLLSIVAFVGFALILYMIKTQKTEALKLLFEIKRTKAWQQAKICSVYDRDLEHELEGLEGEEEDMEEELQIPEGEQTPLGVEAARNIQQGNKERAFKKYSGTFTKMLIEFIIFLLIILGYYLQSYFVPQYLQNLILTYNDEFIRIKQIRTSNDLIHAFFYEMIGKNNEKIKNGVSLFEYLKNLIKSQIIAMRTQEIIHKSKHNLFDEEYQTIYKKIMENSVCSSVDNSTECGLILGGSLEKSLFIANTFFVSKLCELIHNYYINSPNTVNSLKELLNGSLAIELEVVCIRYLGALYDQLLTTLQESIQLVVSLGFWITLVCFIVFCAFLFLSFLWLHFYTINLVQQDLFISNAILSIIPCEIILRTPNIKEHLQLREEPKVRCTHISRVSQYFPSSAFFQNRDNLSEIHQNWNSCTNYSAQSE